mgnify:FL=1|tara:strand:+ start:2009 stop:2236 length:228 start_codon:yes stop_codon:yes gene_type:complete
MTLQDALKHEKIFDKRATGYDILEFLETTYFSKSKQKYIRYGDMHLQHFIRVFQNKEYKITIEDVQETVERLNKR